MKWPWERSQGGEADHPVHEAFVEPVRPACADYIEKVAATGEVFATVGDVVRTWSGTIRPYGNARRIYLLRDGRWGVMPDDKNLFDYETWVRPMEEAGQAMRERTADLAAVLAPWGKIHPANADAYAQWVRERRTWWRVVETLRAAQEVHKRYGIQVAYTPALPESPNPKLPTAPPEPPPGAVRVIEVLRRYHEPVDGVVAELGRFVTLCVPADFAERGVRVVVGRLDANRWTMLYASHHVSNWTLLNATPEGWSGPVGDGALVALPGLVALDLVMAGDATEFRVWAQEAEAYYRLQRDLEHVKETLARHGLQPTIVAASAPESVTPAQSAAEPPVPEGAV